MFSDGVYGMPVFEKAFLIFFPFLLAYAAFLCVVKLEAWFVEKHCCWLVAGLPVVAYLGAVGYLLWRAVRSVAMVSHAQQVVDAGQKAFLDVGAVAVGICGVVALSGLFVSIYVLSGRAKMLVAMCVLFVLPGLYGSFIAVRLAQAYQSAFGADVVLSGSYDVLKESDLEGARAIRARHDHPDRYYSGSLIDKNFYAQALGCMGEEGRGAGRDGASCVMMRRMMAPVGSLDFRFRLSWSIGRVLRPWSPYPMFEMVAGPYGPGKLFGVAS